jgi:pentatricopeptide repeat protein
MAYNTLLHAYSKAGMPEQAQSLLELLVRQYLSAPRGSSPRPQAASFNTVMSAWAKKGNQEKAETLFEWMQDLQSKINTVKPNVITYTNLLNCWAKSKTANQEVVISRVESLIREMENSEDCQPNLVSYTTLCKTYARFGMGAEALVVLRAMPSKDVQPNNIMYTQVIHALAENGVRTPNDTSIVGQTEALMDEMAQRNIQPRITTYSACLKLISAARISYKTERARRIVERMREAGIEPNDVIENQFKRILSQEDPR